MGLQFQAAALFLLQSKVAAVSTLESSAVAIVKIHDLFPNCYKCEVGENPEMQTIDCKRFDAMQPLRPKLERNKQIYPNWIRDNVNKLLSSCNYICTWKKKRYFRLYCKMKSLAIMFTVASGYGDVRVFSEIAKVFPELTRITKAEGFLRCKKRNLNGREVIMWTKTD